ncbi:unnamed protein product [Peronospora farinosa]|uniref:HTH CENPB-type domain-containing protein n=1 Tax=Peronospora farinosa TaxID=134698 RepID=A0AAV0TLP3_9STRA|nr:unnamed protein product [Peronospora farinosa]CAI5722416.1 unnamed protein product [Peronospora farinosa]
MTNEELTCKSRRTVRYPRLDTALARWVSYCEETGIRVTGESIRLKAAAFAKVLEIDTPLTYSNGWLYKFNERHGFGGFKAHKGHQTSSEEALSELQARVQALEARNVFTMDETGLFYTMFPDRSGTRSSKRVTIVLSCNADGSEKLPLLVIGKAEKPRCFTASTAVEMNYQRKIVLLLDNAAVHAGFNAEELKSIEVVFLPSNHLHPLTAGILTAFKRRYRQRQIQYVLDHLDADADISTAAKFDSVGVKQALTWCIACWDAVPSSVITSCWQDTGLLYPKSPGYANECRGEEDAISEELTVMLSWLHAAEPLTVEELLNLPEESVIMDEPTDEDFCAPVDSVKVVVQQAKSKTADADDGLSVQELKERLKWIAKLLIYADEKEVPAESMSGMRILQRDFRDQLNKKQSGSR